MTPAVQIVEVGPGDERFDAVMALAARVLDQDRYLRRAYPAARSSHVLSAFDGERCVGFLRYLIQVIGAAEGRPPIIVEGAALTEGYVEAFGVGGSDRRRGIGRQLQVAAADACRAAGCTQMRSRSPVTSRENYALKLADGYTLHPSEENDSYSFARRL